VMGHGMRELVSSLMQHVFVMGTTLMETKAELPPVSALKNYEICSCLPDCEISINELINNQIQLKTD
jgi:hypothetical protein